MAAFDFAGWATKNDIKCSDGRTIRKNAFKDDDLAPYHHSASSLSSPRP